MPYGVWAPSGCEAWGEVCFVLHGHVQQTSFNISQHGLQISHSDSVRETWTTRALDHCSSVTHFTIFGSVLQSDRVVLYFVVSACFGIVSLYALCIVAGGSYVCLCVCCVRCLLACSLFCLSTCLQYG